MTSKKTLKVLIAGGGIGGLAAALALQRAGHQAIVFERAASMRDGGTGLYFWPSSIQVFRSLGIDDDLVTPDRVQDVRRYGSSKHGTYSSWPVSKFSKKYGLPCIGVDRSTLHRVLSRAFTSREPQGEIRTNAEIVSFEQDESGVTLELLDGKTERGDLLIGADGVHSVVRSLLPGASPLRHSGFTAWRGFVSGVPEETLKPGAFICLLGPGPTFVAHHIGSGRVYWMSSAHSNPDDDSRKEVKNMLLERHHDWSSPVRELISATAEEVILRNDVFHSDPSPIWGLGRVTLLGDAAHPISNTQAQGVGLVLEDALVLADHIVNGAHPIAALRSYEEERKERTSKVLLQVGRVDSKRTVKNSALLAARSFWMRMFWSGPAFRALEREQMTMVNRLSIFDPKQVSSLDTKEVAL